MKLVVTLREMKFVITSEKGVNFIVQNYKVFLGIVIKVELFERNIYCLTIEN